MGDAGAPAEDIAYPKFRCEECFIILPLWEASQHNIKSGHKLKRLDDKEKDK